MINQDHPSNYPDDPDMPTESKSTVEPPHYGDEYDEDYYYYDDDNNDTTYEDILNHHTLRYSKNLWIYLAPILILMGTFGNLFSVIILTCRALRKYTTSVYLVCLSVVDICIIYTSLFRYWLIALVDKDVRKSSTTNCRGHVFMTYFLLHFEAWILVNICTERLAAVFAPLKFRKYFTRRSAMLQLTSVCLVTMVLNIHFFWTFQIKEHIYEDDVLSTCYASEQYTWFITGVWHWIDFSVASLVPFLIMLIFNIAIVSKMMYTRQQNSQRVHFGNMTAILLVTAFVFCVTTMPISIFLCRESYWFPNVVQRHTVGELVWTCLSLLYYVNHSTNFLVYTVSSVRFRQQIRRMCSCCTDQAADAATSGAAAMALADRPSNITLLSRSNTNVLNISSLDTQSVVTPTGVTALGLFPIAGNAPRARDWPIPSSYLPHLTRRETTTRLPASGNTAINPATISPDLPHVSTTDMVHDLHVPYSITNTNMSLPMQPGGSQSPTGGGTVQDLPPDDHGSETELLVVSLPHVIVISPDNHSSSVPSTH